jgi:N-acetylglucosaminyldiphosphoundecaprenol N-acetyl-beta-D-mannosaminyltransferase
MSNNYKKFSALMIGVGGAFPLIAGNQPRASELVRKLGFEWLFRLVLEPRRLLKRYVLTNTRFIFEIFKSYSYKVFKRFGKN